MKRYWIGTGWKMNKTYAEAEAYARALADFLVSHPPRVQVFIIPPFTVLHRVSDLLKNTPVQVGAQNMHWAESGAFTGEISAGMLQDCGAHLVELGHSERRAEFGETDYTVNLKVLAALQHRLQPLVCVGETTREKQFGVACESIVRQLKIALKGVSLAQIENVILAYEPVWAIGETGTPAEPAYANAMHSAMRTAIRELYGDAIALAMPILYGGSVNRDNAISLIEQSQVDGLFVGRAAWQANALIELIQMVDQISEERV